MFIEDIYERDVTNIGGKTRITVKITDTAGLEKEKAVSESIMRKKCVCFIVFDVTNPESFYVEDSKLEGIEYWYEKISVPNAPAPIIRILVGNKANLKNKRKVT